MIKKQTNKQQAAPEQRAVLNLKKNGCLAIVNSISWKYQLDDNMGQL